MSGFNHVCLWVGRAVCAAGGIAIAALLLGVALDAMWKVLDRERLFFQWYLERVRKKRQKDDDA